jgi:hypothetical protein
MSIIALKINEPYPLLAPNIEGVATVLDGASLNFRVELFGLNDDEVKAFNLGEIVTGVYVKDFIPFFAVQIQNCTEFSCFINILPESQNTRDTFLAGNPEANIIRMDLIDIQDKTLRAIRMLGLPVEFMTSIKSTMFEQLSVYKNSDDLIKKALEIEAITSISNMLEYGQNYVFPGRDAKED